MPTEKNSADAKQNRTWWPDDLLKDGFTPIANALFRCRERLGLSPDDLLVLLAILTRVRPGNVTDVPCATSDMMRSTGRSRSTVMRCVSRLEDSTTLKVERAANQMNRFDVTPLFDRLRGALANDLKPATHESPAATNVAATSPQTPDLADEMSRLLLRARAAQAHGYLSRKNRSLPEFVARATAPGATVEQLKSASDYVEEVCELERLAESERAARRAAANELASGEAA